MRFVRTKTGSYNDRITSLNVNISKNKTFEFEKRVNPPTYYRGFQFEVQVPIDNREVNASSYQGNPALVWDTGSILLPTNYDPNGKPVPLVIWCHGTDGEVFSLVTPVYGDFIRALSHNGFAVACCSGFTSYYATDFYGHNVAGLGNSKCSPLLFSCYSALYRYVTENFNVDQGGVYLLSKSAGGLSSNYLAYHQPFKVKAQALLAPALVMAGQSFRVTGKIDLDFWLARLGYVSPDITTHLTNEDRAYILANVQNLYGYDALFLGSDIDYPDTLAKMYAIPADDGSGTESEKVARAYEADDELMGIFDSARKNLPVPTKIWIARDDASVPFMWAEKFVQMARRGNSHCELRVLPNNTGGHHATDTDVNALHCNYLCSDGELVDIPVAYAEAIDFFKQW